MSCAGFERHTLTFLQSGTDDRQVQRELSKLMASRTLKPLTSDAFKQQDELTGKLIRERYGNDQALFKKVRGVISATPGFGEFLNETGIAADPVRQSHA